MGCDGNLGCRIFLYFIIGFGKMHRPLHEEIKPTEAFWFVLCISQALRKIAANN